MVAAHPPFNKATPRDKFYKFIGGKRPDLFWKSMERGKPAGFFSEDFKDLVQSMLALDVTRIDMDSILNHPWMAIESLTNA